MRLTSNHLEFLRRKQPMPKAMRRLLRQERELFPDVALIHHCINDHDERTANHLFAYRRRYSEWHNFIVTLRRGTKLRNSYEPHLRMWARQSLEASPYVVKARRLLRRLYRRNGEWGHRKP